MNDKEKINEIIDLIVDFQGTPNSTARELYGSNDRTNTMTMRNMLEKIKKILED